jgi:hypothetical protein
MNDPKTNENITISTSGTAGPYIIVDDDLTEKVVALLSAHKIPFSIDKGAITAGTGTEADVINLHGEPDLDAVQKLLDAED